LYISTPELRDGTMKSIRHTKHVAFWQNMQYITRLNRCL